MDWRTVHFDWNRARAFLVAAEEGSFSAAARALAVSQPTVSRQVAALEEELGLTLFERVGGGLSLTEAGWGLLEAAREMGGAATRLSLAAAGRSTELSGVVVISASELISAHLLPPVLASLRLDFPGIELELIASNQASDLLRREADIAVRNFLPSEPDLVARNLGARAAALYATPTYLERVGGVSEPADLARCAFFGFDRSDVMVQGLRHLGLEVSPESFPVVSASHLVQWALCKQHAGICIVMEDVGEADPDVVRVLPSLPPLPVPMWLTSHRELRTSRRIRVVFDRLAEALSTGG